MATPEVGSAQGPDSWDTVLKDLRSNDTLIEETVGDLRATVPGYDAVPTQALNASVRRNIALSIRTIREARAPSPEEVTEADALALERHSQGVPIGSVLAGFRVSLSAIYRQILQMAPQAGIPTDQVLASSTLLWGLGDAFSTRAVAVYQEKEVSRAVADSTRRAEWIRHVVTVSMPAAERLRGATLYDVPTTEPVRALVADAPPGTEVERQRRLQAWAEQTGVRVLAAVQGSSLVGLMLGEPVPCAHPKGLTEDMNAEIFIGLKECLRVVDLAA